jgi:hypothetical protein
VPHTVGVSNDRPLGLPEPARTLLEAVTAISSDLDLPSVLGWIVKAATELTGRGTAHSAWLAPTATSWSS